MFKEVEKINYTKRIEDKAMTREEEIEKAVYSYSKQLENRMNGIDYFNQENVEYAFIDGIEWADANPKSTWISVDDDLPCNHEELIENEYYTKKVLVVLASNIDPSKKCIEICNMCNTIGSFNTDWYWQITAYYHVVYWKPLPELPKE